MTLTVSLQITGEATGAKKAVDETTTAVTKLGTAAKTTSQQAASAGQVAAAGATRAAAGVGSAAQLTTQQMAQMQFQLQDIGVGLASGQSPFMVLMQQGSQMTQMFGAGTGPMAALRAVGTGITSFLTNPLNLALLGFAGATAAASYFFSTIVGGADDADAALEREEELIKQIKARWGEAAVAVEEYKASRERMSFDAAEDVETKSANAEAALRALREELENVSQVLSLPGAETAEPQLRPLLDLVNTFIADLADGSAPLEEFNSKLLDMGNAAASGSDLRVMAKDIADLVEVYLDALAKLTGAEARRAIVDAPVPGFREAERASMRAWQQIESNDRRKAQREELERLGRQDAQARDLAAEATKREGKAVEEHIASLQDELAVLQLSGRELALHNALRQLGTGASKEQAKEVARLAGEIYDLREAQDAAADRMATLRSIGTGMASSFRQAREAGKSWGEALLASLDRLDDRLMDLAQNSIFDMLFGLGKKGGGGGLFARIFSGVGAGGPKMQLKLNAVGAVYDRPTLFAYAGGLGVMGEAGPEAVMPLNRVGTGYGVGTTDGGSLPLTRLSSGKLGVKAFAMGDVFGAPPVAAFSDADASSGTFAPVFNYNIDARGSSMSKDEFRQIARETQQDTLRRVPGIVAKAHRDRIRS